MDADLVQFVAEVYRINVVAFQIREHDDLCGGKVARQRSPSLPRAPNQGRERYVRKKPS